jgi:hypothetical protein
MSRTTRPIFRLAALALALSLATGCSWWRHRHEPAPADTAASASEAAAELGLAPAPATPDDEALRAATALATDFYEMRQRLGRSGLPDAGEMKAYRAFLCPSLAAAIDEARTRQQAYVLAHPDDKPPLVDGDLFSSLFEGADVVLPAGTEVEGAGARVGLTMRAGEGEGATRWKDSVLLARAEGIWCIADVEYHGDWPFANKGRLSTTLAAPF